MAIQINAARVLKSLAGLVVGILFTTAVAVPVIVTRPLVFDHNYATLVLAASAALAAFALPVGLISHAALHALKRWGLMSYVAAGAAGGFIFSLCTIVPLQEVAEMSAKTLRYYAALTAGYMVWAAGCALIAWFIRRPDKDAVVPLDTHV